ncbi:MAG: hypothetical protein DRI48_10280 [Chloroflexi bacterium]|nr:MAG: hypothetical protein DRI48_10280 [Chloroflexota bacterium]
MLHQNGGTIEGHALSGGIPDRDAGRQFGHVTTDGEHAVTSLDSDRFQAGTAIRQSGQVGENDRLMTVVAAIEWTVVDGLPDVPGSRIGCVVDVQAFGFVGHANGESFRFWRRGWSKRGKRWGNRRLHTGWTQRQND